MESYLAKILELGLQEGDELNLSEKQTKEMISQKLLKNASKKRNKREKDQANNHGMTEEELIAEQQKLFNNAKQYNYDSSDQSENGEGQI